MTSQRVLIALAGQPNSGKSTVFNALTGASQHVANYPGVTVDKMAGVFKNNGTAYEVVDLPGTYSLTSYSPEERVSRDFILHESPRAVINVLDASNLKRSLYLTFQLTEMEVPLVLDLNMMDVAESRGMRIDARQLEKRLSVPVVPTVIKKGKGKPDLLRAIAEVTKGPKPPRAALIDYIEMEPVLRDIEAGLGSAPELCGTYPARWLAIKLMEGDEGIEQLIRERHPDGEGLLAFVTSERETFEIRYEITPAIHIAHRRYGAADEIVRSCVKTESVRDMPLSDKIDRFVCHKIAGPAILVGVIWLLYYLSIVQGYNVTNYTWPLLAKLRSLTEAVMPAPGFIEIPLIRSFALWFVDSINALLNYIPIFFILFGLIAVLEDSGYMPRMAFIMDRLFSRFGLHGQSTLPMVLGGIYVGGCAVPGVMSCKGIPDERSRLATVLIIPMLNCLAKVPLYVLMVNIYFADHKGLAMFFISTVSLLMVLPVSKALTLTVLRKKETAPFVMEMPPYHIPTVRGVLKRAVERVWLFIRKITTIVAAVAVVIFVLLQFPGLSDERAAHFEGEKEKALSAFFKKIDGTPYTGSLRDGDRLMALVTYWSDYKDARMRISDKTAMEALNERFEARDARLFRMVQPGRDRAAKTVNRAFKGLFRERKGILRDMRKERINSSFLGRLGRWLEPATRAAGFNWRVNVALLSAFAAKESSVATLGALYQQEEENETLETRMAREEGHFTPLHALALMLFMVLYPPCLATTMAVKVQTGSFKWMFFSVVYPMVLGGMVATLVFSGGSALGLSGLQAMFLFYGLALALTVFMGFLKNHEDCAH
ncbi:MAG: ferrous iron transport protein B [Thermodesulfobacteriota bacterium]